MSLSDFLPNPPFPEVIHRSKFDVFGFLHMSEHFLDLNVSLKIKIHTQDSFKCLKKKNFFYHTVLILQLDGGVFFVVVVVFWTISVLKLIVLIYLLPVYHCTV